MLADAPLPLVALTPEILLAVAGCLALLVAQSRQPAVRGLAPWLVLLGLVSSAVWLWTSVQIAPQALFGGLRGSGLVCDQLTAFVRVTTVIVGVLITLVMWALPQDSERGEFYSLLAFALVGVLLVGAADDMAVLFLGLELVALPTYVLVALSSNRIASAEASTKYFFLGALAAALTAYGLSFLYGVAGTTNLTTGMPVLSAAVRDSGSWAGGLAAVGLMLTLGGLLFKLGAAPLHFYLPDVYQGAASPVVALLGFAPKFAGAVALLKLFTLVGWPTLGGPLFWVLWLLAVVSMCLGNFLALRQTNIKRMLAYSGVAHAGYMLVALLAGPTLFGATADGAAAVLYYITVYALANLLAFAVLGLLRTHGRPAETLREVAGLVRRHPALALLLALAMLTLMGMPPTAGFWGKLRLFSSAFAWSADLHAPQQQWTYALVVIAVVNSAVGAAYYLRVMAAVLVYENPEPAEAAPRDTLQMGVMLCGLMLLVLAVRPTDLLARSREATQRLGELLASSPARMVSEINTRSESP